MGIQKPGLLEQLIINGGLAFVPIQLGADRGFDITYGRQVGRRYSQVHRRGSAFRSLDAGRREQTECSHGKVSLKRKPRASVEREHTRQAHITICVDVIIEILL